MEKKVKPKIHFSVKSKYFKHTLNLFKNVGVCISAWATCGRENFTFFTNENSYDIKLTPFGWGDPIYTLCIYPCVDGYKDTSITLPVIVQEWDLGDNHLFIPSNVVKQLAEIIPEDNLLIDFYIYNGDTFQDNIDVIILKSDEFSAFTFLH